MAFCATQPRSQLLRTVSRASLQMDGCTLVQSSMSKYVESIFPVVKSIMDARHIPATPPPVQPPFAPPVQPPNAPPVQPPFAPPQNPSWGDSLVTRLADGV